MLKTPLLLEWVFNCLDINFSFFYFGGLLKLFNLTPPKWNKSY